MTRATQCNSKTGYNGVTYHARVRKYQASIQYDGIRKHLGYFSTPEAARDAYIEAKEMILTIRRDIDNEGKK